MEDNEKIRLSAFVVAATDFNADPSDANAQRVQSLMEGIQVREYIPLKEKELITAGVIRALSPDFDAVGTAGFLEILKIQSGLLAYCVNLENDVGTISHSFALYDLYHRTGLVDYIVSKCEKDYGRLCHMIDEALNFSNIYRLIESAQLFDDESYGEWTELLAKVKDTLSSAEVKDFLSAMSSETPEGKELLTALSESSFDQVRAESEKEGSKAKAIADKAAERNPTKGES